jgi:FMN phosphatase YigB (HAD superfamily)
MTDVTTTDRATADEASEHSRTIVFDFDGTVALGAGPVLRYAQHAARSIDDGAAAIMLTVLRDALESHPDGRVPGTEAIDGYDLVRIHATAHGIPADALGTAFLRSREELATELAPIRPPEGLAELLRRLRERTRLLLVTNSPDIRIGEALDALGLDWRFDEVVTGAGKPHGLEPILRRELATRAPEHVLSVGDIWVNDLAPAAALGCATALIGSVPEGAEPTFAAERIEDLYERIEAWAVV